MHLCNSMHHLETVIMQFSVSYFYSPTLPVDWTNDWTNTGGNDFQDMFRCYSSNHLMQWPEKDRPHIFCSSCTDMSVETGVKQKGTNPHHCCIYEVCYGHIAPFKVIFEQPVQVQQLPKHDAKNLDHWIVESLGLVSMSELYTLALTPPWLFMEESERSGWRTGLILKRV